MAIPSILDNLDMPRSAVHGFTGPDRMQQAVRAASFQLAVTGRGTFDATLTPIDLHHMWMQRGVESSARVADATCDVDRMVLLFADHAGSPMRVGRHDIESGIGFMMRFGPRQFRQAPPAAPPCLQSRRELSGAPGLGRHGAAVGGCTRPRQEVWPKEYEHPRLPYIFNLRTDRYERSQITSNTYCD